MLKWLTIAFGIALLAAGAWFSATDFMTSLERRRQKQTMADMRTIGTALEARAADLKSLTMGPVRHVPAGTLHRVAHEDLARALIPTYTRELPRLDQWGEPIRVYVGNYDEKGRARDYLVRTFGSDRRADTSHYTYKTISRFSEDVVYANGNFLQRPEGI
jgi:hypothetical protein